MASFYGNIKNNSRASFIFDRIYPSRVAMDEAMTGILDSNDEVRGDGVFVNRYVLINYGYTAAGEHIEINPSYVHASGDPNAANSSHIVTENNYRNFLTYNDVAHSFEQATRYYTRQELNQGARYYQVKHFYDRYEIDTTGNGKIENSYFASNREIDAVNYHADYHLTVWMKIYTDGVERYIQVGRLKAEAPALELCDAPPSQIVAPTSSNNNDGNAWNQHAPFFDLIQSSDINYKYYMPKNWDIKLGTVDFNKAGFNAVTKSYYSGAESSDNIVFKIGASGYNYPKMIGQKIELTPDTYVPNKYFTDANCTVLATGDFVVGTQYYVKTQQYINGVPQTVKAGDRKNLTITMRSIGNAVSDVYDSIYGDTTHGSNRPYTRADLYKYSQQYPYENLTANDKVCVTWAMLQMKPYISELRYLSHGQTNTDAAHPGIGLQSDWTMDDMDAFGYIYHKPRVLWTGGYNSSNNTWTNPNGTSADTHYMAAHTIEYIYDHYTTDVATLFGTARNNATWLNARH